MGVSRASHAAQLSAFDRVTRRRASFLPTSSENEDQAHSKTYTNNNGGLGGKQTNLKPTKKMYKEGSEGKTIGPVGLKTGAVGGAHDHHSSAGQYNTYAGDFW